jgi:hypothetical protein
LFTPHPDPSPNSGRGASKALYNYNQVLKLFRIYLKVQDHMDVIGLKGIQLGIHLFCQVAALREIETDR